jgi:hypothetical protein
MAVGSLCAYSAFICFSQLQKLKAQTAADIRKGERSGDLYIQYHLNFFQPATDAAIYWQKYRKANIPLVEACRMDEELLKYLSWQGWNRNTEKRLSIAQTLANYDTVDILIERPANFLDTFRVTYPAAQITELLPGLRQVQILRVVQKPKR